MLDEETLREAIFTFEGQLHSVTNNMKAQTGVLIKLLIHPNDVPEGLLTHTTATRFRVAMAEIGDDEQPVVPSHIEAGKGLIANASKLCRDDRFQTFMATWATNNKLGPVIEDTLEDQTRAYVRAALNVESLSELKENQSAQRTFRALRDEFQMITNEKEG